MKKISVVTVVYNAQDNIKRTIESVLSQSIISDIEYVVIDGKSTDNTLVEVNKYRDEIDIIVSEPDTGIYNAMNKALNYINGEWVIFLNAGDVFEHQDSLRNVLLYENELTQYSLLGFSTIIKLKNKTYREKVKDLKKRWTCIPACHQSLLIRSSVHKENPYNEKYKICSDHEFFNRLINSGFAYFGIDDILSIFSFDGVSANNRVLLYKEKLMIAHDLGAPAKEKFKLYCLIVRLNIIKFLKNKLLRLN